MLSAWATNLSVTEQCLVFGEKPLGKPKEKRGSKDGLFPLRVIDRGQPGSLSSSTLLLPPAWAPIQPSQHSYEVSTALLTPVFNR